MDLLSPLESMGKRIIITSWPVNTDCLQAFTAMVESQFKDLPGEAEVLNGNYKILHADSYDVSLHQDNWEQNVKPGIRLVLSVLVRSQSLVEKKCARGCISPLRRQTDSRAQWFVQHYQIIRPGLICVAQIVVWRLSYRLQLNYKGSESLRGKKERSLDMART